MFPKFNYVEKDTSYVIESFRLNSSGAKYSAACYQ